MTGSPSGPGLAKYPHVFSPIKIGPVEVRNRFYFSPHGTPLTAASESGSQESWW